MGKMFYLSLATALTQYGLRTREAFHCCDAHGKQLAAALLREVKMFMLFHNAMNAGRRGTGRLA